MSSLANLLSAFVAGTASPHPVVEFRQYKLVAGKHDQFVELFEREFIETQEAENMELIGQFADLADSDRFIWIRAFRDMEVRQRGLNAFYSGPVWQAHRSSANSMIIDSDNVLLLRPAWAGSGFAPITRSSGSHPPTGKLAVVSIHYLWQQPDDGFTQFFKTRFAPALDRAGMEVDAAMVREEAANNFPRLPVREGEKLFVWVTRVESEAAWKSALKQLEADPEWNDIKRALFNFEERPGQRLFLNPTPRSKFR